MAHGKAILFSDMHRVEEIAPKGLYGPEDSEEAVVDQAAQFVVGGFQAL